MKECIESVAFALNDFTETETLNIHMALAPFTMTTQVDSDATIIELSGAIDELAHFAEFKLLARVVVKLDRVTFLNSVGTRTWCLWIQRFRAPMQVTLMGCPPIMVKSFSTIKNFLTDRCTIKSFYVPFYSEKTGEHVDFLAERGTHFGTAAGLTLPEIRDSKGEIMEIDVVPETYFAFLKPI